jgi:hypothetical protein
VTCGDIILVEIQPYILTLMREMLGDGVIQFAPLRGIRKTRPGFIKPPAILGGNGRQDTRLATLGVRSPLPPVVRELLLKSGRFSGDNPHTGKNWVGRFMQCHPEIKSKLGRKIDVRRIENTQPEVLQPWFTQLKQLLTSIRPTTTTCGTWTNPACLLQLEPTSKVLRQANG